MLICLSCKGVFDDCEPRRTVDHVPCGEGNVDVPAASICPHCSGDDLHEAAECACCGEIVAKDTLDCGLCDECGTDLYKTLKEFWNALSPAQKEWAGEHCDDWMEG